VTSPVFRPFGPDRVKLLPGLFYQRYELNKKYMASLSTQNLLIPHYMEAGLWAPPEQPKDIHWGWESPTCQLRGTFVGHWLWAAARIAVTHAHASSESMPPGRMPHGDPEFRGRAERIISEIGRCQKEHGGEWAGSIPPTYLEWAGRGKYTWAPHYVLHKQLMGLLECHKLLGNEQALDICVNWAEWFHRWTGQFNTKQMDDILDVETGGMLEAWADLYGITKNEKHLDLIHRYDRRRLFDRLIAGEDPLTNMHANTTIPEAVGAARAWEVTGEKRYRDVVEAYWKCAVTDRGMYCTGGQTCGEIWTPPHNQAARLGDKNQEHCTVYNMQRLADYLLRWTGEAQYADYWERNLYNGILAAQNATTGMVTYFLPLRPGSTKKWSTPTGDFWCCVCTLVQAQTMHNMGVFHEDQDGLVVTQFVPSELSWQRGETPVKVTLAHDYQKQHPQRPLAVAFDLTIATEKPLEFALRIRLPEWLAGPARIAVNGTAVKVDSSPRGYAVLKRTWAKDDKVHVELPTRLWTHPLPDEPNTVAFMEGPLALAALTSQPRTLTGDLRKPETILGVDNEREWGTWKVAYHTRDDGPYVRFTPLYEVQDEAYSVYWRVQSL
jgi:uncharacterized protein